SPPIPQSELRAHKASGGGNLAAAAGSSVDSRSCTATCPYSSANEKGLVLRLGEPSCCQPGWSTRCHGRAERMAVHHVRERGSGCQPSMGVEPHRPLRVHPLRFEVLTRDNRY